jgi:hypothetical protein
MKKNDGKGIKCFVGVALFPVNFKGIETSVGYPAGITRGGRVVEA